MKITNYTEIGKGLSLQVIADLVVSSFLLKIKKCIYG